jgi:hypothetical protein
VGEWELDETAVAVNLRRTGPNSFNTAVMKEIKEGTYNKSRLVWERALSSSHRCGLSLLSMNELPMSSCGLLPFLPLDGILSSHQFSLFESALNDHTPGGPEADTDKDRLVLKLSSTLD